jgi:hypothetical protein
MNNLGEKGTGQILKNYFAMWVVIFAVQKSAPKKYLLSG